MHWQRTRHSVNITRKEVLSVLPSNKQLQSDTMNLSRELSVGSFWSSGLFVHKDVPGNCSVLRPRIQCSVAEQQVQAANHFVVPHKASTAAFRCAFLTHILRALPLHTISAVSFVVYSNMEMAVNAFSTTQGTVTIFIDSASPEGCIKRTCKSSPARFRPGPTTGFEPTVEQMVLPHGTQVCAAV